MLSSLQSSTSCATTENFEDYIADRKTIFSGLRFLRHWQNSILKDISHQNFFSLSYGLDQAFFSRATAVTEMYRKTPSFTNWSRGQKRKTIDLTGKHCFHSPFSCSLANTSNLLIFFHLNITSKFLQSK